MSGTAQMLTRRRLMGSSIQLAGAAALFSMPAFAQVATPASTDEKQKIDAAKLMLAQANRILAHEGALDIVGHVSMRHPTRPGHYLLARSRNAAQVTVADILEFDTTNTSVTPAGGRVYAERFIHGAFYAARPDVGAVLHSHSQAILPFTISDQPLQPALFAGALMGGAAPVWDPRESFGDATDGIVTTLERGQDLVRKAGKTNVVLIRGHGYAAVQPGIIELTFLAIELINNATVQREALSMGGKINPLTPGEIATSLKVQNAQQLQRLWDYWLTRADISGIQG